MIFTTQPRAAYPQHSQITYLRLDKIINRLRPWRFWRHFHALIRNFYLNIRLGSTQENIWLSTYFTRPPIKWQGAEIVMVHDFIYERFPDLLPNSVREIQRKQSAIQSAQIIICISQTTAKDLISFYSVPQERIFVVHLSHDPVFKRRTAAELNNTQPFRFIMYVGHRNHYKGFDTLLDAYERWRGRPHIKLLVIGHHWTSGELSVIMAKGLQEDVILLKNIDDDHLCDLYNQAEAFIYPSMYEGFGIPLLEAMACGCPVVASHIPSTQEVAADIPYYFKPGDSNHLMAALDAVIGDEHRQTRVTQGIARSGQFSWDKAANDFYHVLRKLS